MRLRDYAQYSNKKNRNNREASSHMRIRKTLLEDLDVIIDIYTYARLYMQKSGNTTQWINGYPSKELLTKEIIQGNSYVCLDLKEQIIGTFSFIIGEDVTYATIYDGKWLNEQPYGVVHRLASSGKEKGVGKYCLAWCYAQCSNIRVDTHADNLTMQHLLKEDGYTYCGIILCQNGSERLAYQKEYPTK